MGRRDVAHEKSQPKHLAVERKGRRWVVKRLYKRAVFSLSLYLDWPGGTSIGEEKQQH